MSIFLNLLPFEYIAINNNPIIIAGDSISATIATMCPCRINPCDSRYDDAVTKVTALTEP